MAPRFTDVDDYVAAAADDARRALEEIRHAVRQALPGCAETIRYDMPTVTVDGRSVLHYAGWKRHVSVYPVPELDADLERAFAPYRSARATAKFPLNQPVPVDIIARLAVVLARRGADDPPEDLSDGRSDGRSDGPSDGPSDKPGAPA